MKLINDNCLNVIRELAENSVDCIITDPPYYSTAIEFDKQPKIDFDEWFNECFRVLKNTGILVCFSDFRLACKIANRKEFWYEIIWNKTMAVGFLDANQRPLRAHEYILIFSKEKKKSTYNPQKIQGKAYSITRKNRPIHYNSSRSIVTTKNLDGLRFPTSVQTWSNVNFNSLHPTQKPLETLEWLVKTYSNDGDLILDPFMGSGSTGEAAIRNNRDFVGIELDSNYFDIAENRLKNKVGLFLL